MERKSATRARTHRPSRKGTVRQQMIGELSRESSMIEVRKPPSIVPVPSPMTVNPTFTKRYRFRQSAAGNANVTATCLFNLTTISLGSTSFRSYYGSMRLLKVEAWTSVESLTAGSNNMGLEFFPDLGADVFDQGPPISFEAVSSGTSKPGHLHVRPGVLTKLGRTMNASSANSSILFRKSGQAGDIVEVTVEVTLLDGAINNTRTMTGSGGSAGYIMENTFLDNTSTSGTSGSQLLTNLTTFIVAVVVG